MNISFTFNLFFVLFVFLLFSVTNDLLGNATGAVCTDVSGVMLLQVRPELGLWQTNSAAEPSRWTMILFALHMLFLQSFNVEDSFKLWLLLITLSAFFPSQNRGFGRMN